MREQSSAGLPITLLRAPTEIRQITSAVAKTVLAAGVFGNELLPPLGLQGPLRIHQVTVLRSTPAAPTLHRISAGVADAFVCCR